MPDNAPADKPTLIKAVLRTLIYSDLFNFPLTQQELYLYLEKTPLPSPEPLSSDLARSHHLIDSQSHQGTTYFFLPGRQKLIKQRLQRQQWSQEKAARGQKAARYLGLVPWIKFVGLTGTVATENAQENDDIDLLIISSYNRVWLARIGEKLVTETLRLRRPPREETPTRIKNKICPNIYLDEKQLSLSNHDLFTARETAQMKVLYNRDQIYEKFLQANRWVKKFLPNWWQATINKTTLLTKATPPTSRFLDRVETLAQKIQRRHMAPRQTTEKVTATQLMFHPQDQRQVTLAKYREKIRELGLEGLQKNLKENSTR